MNSEEKQRMENSEILVVDDTLPNLELLTRLLTSEGYKARPANSGELALASANAKAPDLILLDVKMPGLDGHEVCRRFKSEERNRDIPVIFISALDDMEDKVKGFEAGGLDYITKPFHPAEVLARVKIHLELRRVQKELKSSYMEVEERVRQRTMELEEANKKLKEEITERKKAEEQLHKVASAAQRSRAELEAVIQSMVGGVVVFDMTGNVVLINKAEAKICGYASPEEMKRDLAYFAQSYALTYPDGRQVPLEDWPIARVLRGESVVNLELRGCRLATGQQWFFSFSGNPVKDSQGNQILAAIVTRDISEQKKNEEEIHKLNTKLEQRVVERTSQLEAANKELETFSYSVSHDLRAPLRGIDGWSLALLEDYYDNLDNDAKVYISRVRSETQRMGQLIDDMLKLSQIGRTAMHLTHVDLSSLALKITSRLKEENPSRKIDFAIQPDMSAEGDEHLLEIALTNLLNNAVKFTGRCEQARVEFRSEEMDGGCVYFVRDNGAGFDMSYAQKLFGAFQRMHRMTEFPGTGVGLATVQRIIHQHGGKIWADAKVDHGATFYFTIQGSIKETA